MVFLGCALSVVGRALPPDAGRDARYDAHGYDTCNTPHLRACLPWTGYAAKERGD